MQRQGKRRKAIHFQGIPVIQLIHTIIKDQRKSLILSTQNHHCMFTRIAILIDAWDSSRDHNSWTHKYIVYVQCVVRKFNNHQIQHQQTNKEVRFLHVKKMISIQYTCKYAKLSYPSIVIVICPMELW